MFSHWGRLTLTLFFYTMVEERAVVHVGIRGAIVSVEAKRTRIATIVRIEQRTRSAKTGTRVLPASLKAMQRYKKYHMERCQRAIFYKKRCTAARKSRCRSLRDGVLLNADESGSPP